MMNTSSDWKQIALTPLVPVLVTGLYYNLHSVPKQIFLVFHSLYFIVTFNLSYPKGHWLRKILVTFLLTFSDYFITQIFTDIFNLRMFWVLLLIFAGNSIIYFTLDKSTVYNYMKQPVICQLVFTIEGFYKAMTLVGTLALFTQNLSSHSQFLLSVIFGTSKLASATVVTFLDSFFCLPVPVRELNQGPQMAYTRSCVMISVLAVVMTNIQSVDRFSYDIFNPRFSYTHLTISCICMLWYNNDALDYLKYFK